MNPIEEIEITPKTSSTIDLAKRIRIHVLKMVYNTNSSHIGSCYSIADILAVLYGKILKLNPSDPKWELRDRFILSKGHAGAALYSVLAESGFFSLDELNNYNQDGSILSGHVMYGVPGVELSTGSLGHGLSVACGMAYAGKMDSKDYRVFTLLSDGECNEGSIWEGVMFAAHHKLNNLIIIVDYNKIQSLGRVEEIMNLEPFVDKWRAFGWDALEVDGHNHEMLMEVCSHPTLSNKPRVIIAHTVKGKGVSFMEDKLLWHYKSPDLEQFKLALSELI